MTDKLNIFLDISKEEINDLRSVSGLVPEFKDKRFIMKSELNVVLLAKNFVIAKNILEYCALNLKEDTEQKKLLRIKLFNLTKEINKLELDELMSDYFSNIYICRESLEHEIIDKSREYLSEMRKIINIISLIRPSSLRPFSPGVVGRPPEIYNQTIEEAEYNE